MTQRTITSQFKPELQTEFQPTIPGGSVAGQAALATTVLVLITLLITVLTGAGFGYV